MVYLVNSLHLKPSHPPRAVGLQALSTFGVAGSINFWREWLGTPSRVRMTSLGAPAHAQLLRGVLQGGRFGINEERIFIELMTSDRKLKASREGSKLRIYGT